MAIDPKKKVLNSVDSELFGEDGSDVNEEEEEVEASPSSLTPTGKFRKILLACILIGVVFVGIVLVVAQAKGVFNKESEPSNEPVAEVGKREDTYLGTPWLDSTNTPVQDQTSDIVLQEGRIVPGITDISQDRRNYNDTKPQSESFVKDLNSLPVEEHFEVAEIYTTVDFISYEKKRAITGDGVEVYWLDAQYKGKPAIVQVPFKIFKELDPIGVTVVDVEVVRVRTENYQIQEIVTGFTVRPDYKEVLERNRR